MKKNKMIVFFLLILCLSFSTVSCGKEKVNEENKNETSTQISQEDNEKEKVEAKEEESKKLETEEDIQQEQALNSGSSDIDYTYESIIDTSGGIVRIPDAVEGPKAIDWYQEEVKRELENLKLKPLSENASEEEIKELFKQILKVGSYDYSPIDEIERFPYVIFKKDKIDPWTNRKVEENMQVNIEIVLDASGSMTKKIDGVSMMDIAKNSIEEVLSQMPENANVGLRVFGHLGSNTVADKEVSCGANALIHPIAPLDIAGIREALVPIKPNGWTSIAKSIENGANDFKDFNAENNLNILFIITDGIETCGGDPQLVASKLKEGGTNIVLGIIGFNVNANQNNVLRSIAEAGGGHYATAKDAQNLTVELAKIFDMSFSNYHWTTLDDALIDRMKNEHIIILQFNEHIAEYSAGREESFLRMVVGAAEDIGLFPKSSDIYDKLEAMLEDREAKIKPFLMEKYNDTVKRSEEYLESLSARKGEIVAYIPSSTRNERVENVLRNKGGTKNDYQKEGETLKEEQEKSIDDMNKN